MWEEYFLYEECEQTPGKRPLIEQKKKIEKIEKESSSNDSSGAWDGAAFLCARS
jgi:hypothetical protein